MISLCVCQLSDAKGIGHLITATPNVETSTVLDLPFCPATLSPPLRLHILYSVYYPWIA